MSKHLEGLAIGGPENRRRLANLEARITYYKPATVTTPDEIVHAPIAGRYLWNAEHLCWIWEQD